MTPEKLKIIISSELEGKNEVINWHSVELKKCLVEPSKRTFENSFEEGGYLELCHVLEENPKTCDGYKIVYDQEEQEFGLAIAGKDKDVFIGLYGTFIETLEGM